MTITEQFKTKRCVLTNRTLSPEAATTQMDKLKDTLQKMQALTPGFISVTFGAGGSAGGVSTAEVAGRHPERAAHSHTGTPHLHGQRRQPALPKSLI